MNEIKKLEILKKVNTLSCNKVYITGSKYAENILSIPEEELRKKHSYSKEWMERMLKESQTLPKWQKDLSESALTVCETLFAKEDVSKIDKSALSDFKVVSDYRHSYLQTYYKGVTCSIDMSSDYLKIIKEMFLSGCHEAELKEHMYLFFSGNGIPAKKYTHYKWQLNLLTEGYGAVNSPEVWSFLMNCSKEMKQLIFLMRKFSNESNLTLDIPFEILVDKMKEDMVLPVLELLKEYQWKIKQYRLMFPIIKYWLPQANVKELKRFLRNAKGDCVTEHMYLSVLFDNKYEKYPYSSNLIRYIAGNKKKAFYRNTAELYEEGIIVHSLEVEGLWNIINLNELTKDNLLILNKISKRRMEILCGELHDFEVINKRKLTAKEFCYLASLGSETVQLIKIYKQLQLPVDENLIRCREIQNIHIPANEEMNLVYMLRVKRFSKWKEDFSYIKDINKSYVMKILLHYEYLKAYFEEIEKVEDIDFLLKYRQEGTLIQKRAEYLKMEENQEMLEKIGVSAKQAERFAEMGNLEIVKDYYESVGYHEQQRINILKIAKADILGKLSEVKYDNFDKEIGSSVTEEEKTLWINNTKYEEKAYSVAEYDDFRSIMVIGEKPVYSCQSYKSGSYNHCLLSNFDANKKIIYVKRNGEFLARAILRFTKASNDAITSTLGFADVSADSKKETKEEKCLFLEKAYIKDGTSGAEADVLKELMQKLAENKARELHMPLYCNSGYRGESAWKYLYISKSKNGQQYLDSLTGSTDYRDEERFVKAEIKILQ